MAKTWKVVLAGLVLASISAAAPAADEASPAKPEQTAAAAAESSGVGRAVTVIGVCVAGAVAAIGGGYCISRIGMACIDATARQPEAAGQMFAPMIITAAMVEGATLFAIVVCLLGVI